MTIPDLFLCLSEIINLSCSLIQVELKKTEIAGERENLISYNLI